MYRKRERRIGLHKIGTTILWIWEERKLAYPPDILHRLAGGDKGFAGCLVGRLDIWNCVEFALFQWDTCPLRSTVPSLGWVEPHRRFLPLAVTSPTVLLLQCACWWRCSRKGGWTRPQGLLKGAKRAPIFSEIFPVVWILHSYLFSQRNQAIDDSVLIPGNGSHKTGSWSLDQGQGLEVSRLCCP